METTQELHRSRLKSERIERVLENKSNSEAELWLTLKDNLTKWLLLAKTKVKE
jgi:hypothetical protein